MKRIALALVLPLSAAFLVAQALPELFGKAKAEVKAGSFADALQTLDALEARWNGWLCRICNKWLLRLTSSERTLPRREGLPP